MNFSADSLATRFLLGRQATGRVDAGSWVLLAACAAFLGWKAWSISRLNINWDEFYFLTQVHALLRGDLANPFQTTYTQAFRWLPWVGDDEIAQINSARIVMFLLLGLSTWQIIRLAARWSSLGAALTGGLAFLCLVSTQLHGGSFRADSLLLPILLGTLLLLTRPVATRKTDMVAGVFCGIGLAVSVKLALFAPLFLACILFTSDATARLRVALARSLVVGAITLVVAGILVGLHHFSLPAEEMEHAASFAGRSFSKTILETRFLPSEFYVRRLFQVDRFIWISMACGFLVALVKRSWLPAAMVLAVSPVLYYRNAYPYFYVDMLAPAAILVAVLVDQVRAWARGSAGASHREWVPLACGVLLLVQGGARLPILSADQQLGQRRVLAAVHRIFPQPVPYLDHAGMIASFRKVNFFMSTWGMDGYRRRGMPFMAPALREHRPPLLLVNRSYLDVLLPDSQHLMTEDRDALKRFYQPYWGPIYVAGASVVLSTAEAQSVALPFPGRYRLESTEPVVVDGKVLSPGDVIEVAGNNVGIMRQAGGGADPLPVRLLVAEARSPPPEAPQIPYIFLGL